MSKAEYIAATIMILAAAVLATALAIRTYAMEPEYEWKNPYREIAQSLTEEDINALASMVWYESGRADEPIDGQRACVEVVFNRIMNEGWAGKIGKPGSAKDVIYEKGQFATLWEIRTDGYYTQKQLDVIQMVCEEPPILPHTGYVYFDTGRYNGRDHVKIGRHYFGRGK